MPIEYIGEHLWPRNIGHALIILNFVLAGLAGYAYWRAARANTLLEDDRSWLSLGKWSFLGHGISVMGIIFLMFYVMTHRYYEYWYAQAHVDDNLPFIYTFSAFWEDQEGSFLLWMFWDVILGIILIYSAKKWRAGIMMVMSFMQMLLASMILGLYMPGTNFKIGSNPLILLREKINAPVFQNPDYLELISGNGLNPLLQNYWNVIHPPIMFLGFASTIVPMAFVLSGLMRKEYKAWMKPAKPWTLFSIFILGTGILMGGAWAYEALSFGGYWAWDPVENSSLVPWLMILAGLHTHLIARATGRSIRPTMVSYILGFGLTVYSTFLTRSGVLGDTSVHAFTSLGMEGQLLLFLILSSVVPLIYYFTQRSHVPTIKKEESIYSKEFWMLIGSFVLIFSVLIITVSTSMPIFNKLIQSIDPTSMGYVIQDPVSHYNKFHVWIAFFIGILSGGSQFLRYKETKGRSRWRKLSLRLSLQMILAIILTFITTQIISVPTWPYRILLVSAWFTIVSNLDYIISIAHGKWNMLSAGIAHIGFGIMIIGVLASGLNQYYISSNPFAQRGLIEGFTEDDLQRNIMLVRDMPMPMPSGYELTYIDDTLDYRTRTFTIRYREMDSLGSFVDSFRVYPTVIYDKNFTKVAATNPDTKHYWDFDIYSHISSLPARDLDQELAQKLDDSLNYQRFDVLLGDTIYTSQYYGVVQSVTKTPTHEDYVPNVSDFAIGVTIDWHKLDDDHIYITQPTVALRQNFLYNFPVEVPKLQLKVRLNDTIVEQLIDRENRIDYTSFTLPANGTFDYGPFHVQLTGFQQQPELAGLAYKEGDIAVAAIMNVTDTRDNSETILEPIFLIRDRRTMQVKRDWPAKGLHVKFMSIDPQKGEFTFDLGYTDMSTFQYPIEVAEQVSISDFIVLEAKVFPGINYFWIGSITMLIGALMALFRSRK